MSLFLQAQCGSTRMLIEVDRVLEVCDASAQYQPVAGSGHITWRDQVIGVVNMPLYLGLPEIPVRRLVVVESGLPDPAFRFLALAVESSESLLSLEVGEMADTLDHCHELATVFSAICSPTDSTECLLRLRFPLTWALPLLTGVKAA